MIKIMFFEAASRCGDPPVQRNTNSRII